VAFGPLLRSTMMASPIGMVLAASSTFPPSCQAAILKPAAAVLGARRIVRR